ncbi:hypothetical protein CRG98_032475 [Punica granatum]|nr:hypothetical protein CRG98_032475 [Punica granatum]
MLLSWIFNHLDEELQNLVAGARNAKTLWDDLKERFSQARLMAYKEKEKLHQFLIGLNPEFQTIRSQILSMEPLPNANRAHSIAANDEAQRLITHGRETISESLGFAAKISHDFGGGSNPNPNFSNFTREHKPRSRPFCDYCGWNGHFRATCYQLNGYPGSDQRNPKGSGAGGSRPGGRNSASSPSTLQNKQGGGGGVGFSFLGGPGNSYSGGPSDQRQA